MSWTVPIKPPVDDYEHLCHFANNEINRLLKAIQVNHAKFQDVLLDDFIDSNANMVYQAHLFKVVQMKTGELWQNFCGGVRGIQNLKVGHATGLDLKSSDEFARGLFGMELKNRYNTDNSSSKKQNLTKLAKFARANAGYTPIYAYVNAQHPEGEDTFITFDDVPIRILSGYKLFRFMFDDKASHFVTFVKKTAGRIIKEALSTDHALQGKC